MLCVRLSKHTDCPLLFLHMIRNRIKYEKGIVSGNSTNAFDLPTVESIAWGESALYSYVDMWSFVPELFGPDKQLYKRLQTTAQFTYVYIHLYIHIYIDLFAYDYLYIYGKFPLILSQKFSSL
jgi:hypothetical protein